MSAILTIMVMKVVSNMNPIFMAMMILVMSVVVTTSLFKTTMSSWISFVTILTFSSGMMTLFMYTASLSPNEKTKSMNLKPALMIVLMSMMMMSQHTSNKQFSKSMKNFSNSMMIMIMATILILSMVAISTHGHHPNQTVSSSF